MKRRITNFTSENEYAMGGSVKYITDFYFEKII